MNMRYQNHNYNATKTTASFRTSSEFMQKRCHSDEAVFLTHTVMQVCEQSHKSIFTSLPHTLDAESVASIAMLQKMELIYICPSRVDG